jgi:hypothetical protein
MRRNLRPLLCPLHLPPPSQIRQRPKYRSERLSRLGRHRAPQQELRSREPIFQTDLTARCGSCRLVDRDEWDVSARSTARNRLAPAFAHRNQSIVKMALVRGSRSAPKSLELSGIGFRVDGLKSIPASRGDASTSKSTVSDPAAVPFSGARSREA